MDKEQVATFEISALLQAAKDDLDSDPPRIAIANWLAENGAVERASFVRAMIEASRARAEFRSFIGAHNTYRRLLGVHRNEWLGPFTFDESSREYDEEDELPNEADFSRGLIQLRMHADYFLNNHEQFTSCPTWHWVERLHFWGLSPESLQRLIDVPELTLPPILVIDDTSGAGGYGRLRNEGLRLLAEWPALSQVRSLTIKNQLLEKGAYRPLFQSPHLAGLCELQLDNEYRGDIDDLALELAEATHWKNLRSVSLLAVFGQPALDALGSAPHLAGLTNLNVQLPVSPDSFLPKLMTIFPRLERLTIHTPGIGAGKRSPIKAKGGKALTSLVVLTHLDLSDTALSMEALRKIVNSRLAESLVSLVLPDGNLGPTAVQAIAGIAAFPRLRRFVWPGSSSSFKLNDANVAELAKAQCLSGLTELTLKWHGLGHGDRPSFGARALVASPPWTGLISLDLYGNTSIDDEIALDMAATANLPHLENLNLDECRLTDVGVWAMATAPGLPRLRWIDAYNTRASHELLGIAYLWLNNRTPGVDWDSPESSLSDEQKGFIRGRIQ